MKHLILSCASLVLVLALDSSRLNAAEPEAADDLKKSVSVSIQLSDFARTRQRFAESLYAMIWKHDILEKPRKEFDKGLARNAQEGNPDIMQILNEISSIHASLGTGMTVHGMPKMLAQVAMGDSSEQVWKWLSAQGKAIDVAGADAALEDPNGMVQAARYANDMVFSMGQQPVQSVIKSDADDISMHMSLVDYFDLLKNMPGIDAAMFDKMLEHSKTSKIEWSGSIVPHGIKERIYMDYNDARILGAVDAELLTYLPQQTLLVGAVFLNGAAAQAQMKEVGMQANDAMFKEIDRILSPFGANYYDLMGGVNGTMIFAVHSSVPFPTTSIMLPRSQEVDTLISAALQLMQVTAPEQGKIVQLPIPNMPIMVQLGRSESHWVVSSDMMAINNMVQKQAGGFAQGALAALAKKHCTEDTIAVSFYDSKALLNLAMGYSAFIPQPDIRVQAGDLLMKLGSQVQAGFIEGHWVDGGMEMNAEGIFGSGVFILPMAAAVAIPNLLESKITANESAAQASLKAALFPSQITFQAGGYHDADQNGIGRYGFINELTGNKATMNAAKGDIRILTGGFAIDQMPAISNNYYFKVYLPNGESAAFSSSDEIPIAGLKDERLLENNFVVYAWPKDAGSGRKVFAMKEDGQVRTMPGFYDFRYNAENMPAWNLMWGDDDAQWSDAPVWPIKGF